LKLKFDIELLLSTSAFEFNLRRYIQESHVTALAKTAAADAKATSETSFYNSSSSTSQMEDAAKKAEEKAGSCTRPLFSSTCDVSVTHAAQRSI